MRSDEHSCPVLDAALSKVTLFLPVYLCVCVCVHVYASVCVCLLCLCAPPSFRSIEAKGLTSALPETAAPRHVASDNTPAHHSQLYFTILFQKCFAPQTC